MENDTSNFIVNLVNLTVGVEGIPTYVFVYVVIFGTCAVIGVLGNITVKKNVPTLIS